MSFSAKFSALAAIVALPCVLAQVPLYGQCGGSGWTGATTCVTGATCTVQNQWYSQCVPGTAATTTASTPAAPTATAPAGSKKANYWFSFGDSYTQSGFSPSGALPNDRNPFGNPDYPGWTATGGENWVGYVTTKYNNPCSTPTITLMEAPRSMLSSLRLTLPPFSL